MINMRQLIEALRELADADFQRHAWLASGGATVSSFSEQICQTFDDTGLSDALDGGKAARELTDDVLTIIRELDAAVSKVDQSAPPETLLEDSRVEEVRRIASRLVVLLNEV